MKEGMKEGMGWVEWRGGEGGWGVGGRVCVCGL